MVRITLSTILGMENYLGAQKKQEIEMPENSSVGDLLNQLVELFGDDFKENVLEKPGQLRKGIVLMVNGVNIFAGEGYHTKLTDGDRVLLFPPAAGG